MEVRGGVGPLDGSRREIVLKHHYRQVKMAAEVVRDRGICVSSFLLFEKLTTKAAEKNRRFSRGKKSQQEWTRRVSENKFHCLHACHKKLKTERRGEEGE